MLLFGTVIKLCKLIVKILEKNVSVWYSEIWIYKWKRRKVKLRSSLKTLAVWLIIGIIFIVLLTSILGNSDNKLSYSELLTKVEAGEVVVLNKI